MAGAVLAGDALRFLETLDDIFDRGHDLKKLFSDLLEYLRDLWVIQTSRAPEKLVDLPGHEIERMREQAGQTLPAALEHVLDMLFREEAAIRLSPQPKLALEMAFFRLIQMRGALSIDTLIAKLEDLRREVQGEARMQALADAGRPGGASNGRDRSDVPGARGGGTASAASRMEVAPAGEGVVLAPTGDAWQRVIEAVAGSQPSLAATLKRCVLKQGGRERVEILASGNSFVAQKLKHEKNVAIIRKACAEAYGGAPEVIVTVSQEDGGSPSERRDRRQAQVNQTLSHPVIIDAVDIFNGTIVDVKVSQEVDK